mmetsp:Transcript_89129/g.144394  ORF Transcript_89129/g.144394 Transcript_89129/m.144394 type:complete len:230 (+) Transcript_89129:215-904(+)
MQTHQLWPKKPTVLITIHLPSRLGSGRNALSNRHFIMSKHQPLLYKVLYLEDLMSKPGMGLVVARASALALRAAISALPSRAGRKSLSALPVLACTPRQILTPSSIRSAILMKSSSMKPRDVSAGVPMRTPPGMRAEVSPHTAFLFKVIDASSKTRSALEPVRPWGRRSRSIKWFSVPPEIRVWPSSTKRLAQAAAFLRTWAEYNLNSGVATCFNATARAQMVWLWGPP